MTYELKPNQGSLFNNDRKQSDNHPDLSGSVNITGVEYYLSAWRKQGTKGEWFSIAIGNKKEPKATVARESDLQDRDTSFDDSIPF